MNQEVTEYINSASDDQKQIMEAVRLLVHRHVPGVTEEFKWGRPIFRLENEFAYLQANKSHINLGFYLGFEKLNDPERLLEGTGKSMRHIKLRKMEDIDSNKRLAEWLVAVANTPR